MGEITPNRIPPIFSDHFSTARILAANPFRIAACTAGVPAKSSTAERHLPAARGSSKRLRCGSYAQLFV